MNKTLNRLNVNTLDMQTWKQACIVDKLLIASVLVGLRLLKLAQKAIDALTGFFALVFQQPEKSISGKYVVITGAAGYLAKNLAIEFVKRGANLVLVDKNEVANKTFAEELRKMNFANEVHCITANLSNEQDVRRTCRQIKNRFGTVAIVVMAAAPPAVPKSILDTTYAEDIEHHFKLGYMCQLWLFQELLPAMSAARSGHFVAISSSGAIADVPFLSSYAMGKSVQAKLIETVREEIAVNRVEGVHTTCVFMRALKGGVNHGLQGLIDFDPRACITGEFAASHIVSGVLRNRTVVFVPEHLRLWIVLKYVITPRLWGFVVAFTAKINQKLLKLKHI